MHFPFLASFIIFILILSRVLKRQKKLSEKAEKSFWERERASNSVRRKSLDNLNYIKIPLDTFPTNLLSDNEKVAECLDTLEILSTRPIVNLTGYSNTDLKLEYGTANITLLSEYDQSYTLLVRTLQKWAELLYEAGYIQETRTLLEFALETGTDVSRTYYLLAEIYHKCGEDSCIPNLIEKAQNLSSVNKNTIVHTLQKSYL